jgi:hypothetical protein
VKGACFLLLTLCGVSLMPGAASADTARSTAQQTSPESAANPVSDHPQNSEHTAPADRGRSQKDGYSASGRRDNREVSRKNHPPSSTATKNDRPKQLPNNRKRSSSGNAMNAHQPRSNTRTTATKSALIQWDSKHSVLPVRTASVSRPAAPSPSNARHRGANPAVIGGSANSYGGNSGAINGTRVHRRP